MHTHIRTTCLLLVACLSLTAIQGCAKQTARAVPDGTYYGYEEMLTLSPTDPATRWFHEDELTIRDGLVRLTKRPYTLKNGRAIPQPADGGFYRYEGKITVEAARTIVELSLKSCDYCGVPDGDTLPSKIVRAYVVQLVPNATFELDDVKYRTTRDPRFHLSLAQ